MFIEKQLDKELKVDVYYYLQKSFSLSNFYIY